MEKLLHPTQNQTGEDDELTMPERFTEITHLAKLLGYQAIGHPIEQLDSPHKLSELLDQVQEDIQELTKKEGDMHGNGRGSM